jgi:hypothetical protein
MSLYHVTTKEAYELIKVEGLKPQIGRRSRQANETKPAIYLFADLITCEEAIMNWLGDCFNDDAELLILQVDLPFFHLKEFEVIHHHPIPAKDIKVLISL